MSKSQQLFLAMLLALMVAGCSRSKTMDREALRSEIRSAISITSETRMFIDYVLQGRATRIYAREHPKYLHELIEEAQEELAQSHPDPGTEAVFADCRIQFDRLDRVLATIPSANPQALAETRHTLETVRQELQELQSQL